MSSTSDQTTQQNKKTRLIIDEIGVDTETGIVGRGHSYDNGKTFTVDKTIYGRIYHDNDNDQIWNGIQDKVEKVVKPAINSANSAQSAANAAIESAQVTSDAVTAIASATAEAKQGANDAMSQAKSAWDVATGAKEAVTNFDPLLKSAQSDASKALAQIANTANALSDAKTTFSSDVAVAKNLANAAQTTADSAVKSASSVANDLTAVASQAKANADGITKVTSDVGLLQTTVANNSGNISTIQETAKQIQQAVSDNAGNIMVATQTADSAVAVASDARSNATVAIQTASQTSITAINASGQAASAVLTASGAMTTASNAKSDATVAVQTASGASLTATDAKDDATIAKQTASEATVQASNAESDFAQLSIRANKIEANVANNSGAIASVQQTANGLTTTVADIKANGGGVNLAHNTSNAYVVPGDPINGYKNIGSLSNDEWASLAGETITIGVTIEWTNWQVSGNNRIGFELAPAKNGTGYWNNGFGLWCHPENGSSGKQRVTVTRTLNDDIDGVLEGFAYVQGGCDTAKISELMIERGSVAHDWSPSPDDLQNQFTQTKESIDGITTTINDPKTGLNATYQTAAGNATTISNVKSDVYQLQTTANGLTSRVGNLESKTNTQETAIEQNKNAIALKADQTAVDKINGTVSQLQSSLTVQAGQIQEKVTSSQVTGMLAGYATQEYTQSLITQEAGTINESITNLDAKYSAKDGVNLQRGTGDCSFPISSYNATVTIENYDDHTKMFHVKGTNGFYTSYNAGTSFVPTVGETYTVSADVKGGGTTSGDFFKYEGADSCSLGTVTLTDTWQRISNTVHIGSVRGQWIFYLNNNAGDFYVKHIKIERGSVATPWTPAPSDNATVTQVQSLTASIDGLQSNVTNLKNDTSSQITQLSNNIQSKVSSADFNSKVTQLSNDINLRVTKGNIVSQINQEAGGNTLIQVSNGKGSLILDADNTIITGKAWIPSAALGNISADKIMLGSTSLWNSDGTLNLVNSKDGITSKITVTQGSVNFDGTNKTASIIQFASDNNTNAFTVNPTGATVTPTLFFERFDQTPGHWLGFTRNDTEHEGVMFHTWDDSAERFFVDCHARFDKNLRTIGTLSQGSWDGTTAKPEAGVLTIKNGNTIWSGSDYLAIGTNLTGSYGNVMARSFSQQSTLSSKTNIETVDPKDALNLVNRTDIRSYQYKTDVAQGKTKRYTSMIIDDVNDVSEYYAPDEFTNEERTGRDDGSAVGYLFLAVQELTRRIKTLEDKLNG
ncbi:hypothetical protein [Limosilactobacillus fermentum]|uniref:hypothetical protein n=1 Tax=Limosilactobacillus fermentum TaxID=1613 RepID=UPI0022E5E7D6|nr:hypothetical protein [Limosilactobacillus fermentum]